MSPRLRILPVLLLLVSLAGAQSLKLLTIGNSFADSAFVFLPKVVESVPGCSLVMDRANIGGCSLERHWKEHLKSESDPSYKPYQKKYSLKDLLTRDAWDIVTMQQASPLSFRPESYSPWFKDLYGFVRQNAPKAEVIVQMTWSYREDHPLYTNGVVKDHADMYDKLFGAYLGIAKEFNRRILPTGLAVQLARANQATPFKSHHTDAELAAFVYPARPKEPDGSFMNGHSWKTNRKGEWFLSADRIHLNKRGEYLQACVWFAVLFNRKTSEIAFSPVELSADEASFLRRMAQKAVDEFKQVGTGRY
jgi:hypothetical protein